MVASQTTQVEIPCNLRETSHGSVCVCNSTYCDYLGQPELTDNSKIVVISSSKVSQLDYLSAKIAADCIILECNT